MQTHIAENLSSLLDNYLPHGYSNIVALKAGKKGITVSKNTVRSVRSGLHKNLDILDLLIEVAKEKQAVAEALTEKLTA